MKKLSKYLAFFLLISSIIMPVLPAIAGPVTAAPITYRSSTSAQIVTGNWDPTSTDGYNILMTYRGYALEFPMSGYADYWGGLRPGIPKEDEWWPILATSWTTTYWVGSNNSLLFNNSGGREAIEFTLRDGVKFHDGSDWNASVMKWNIDRQYLITGNLTGNANGIYDQRNTANIWDSESEWSKYYDANWNLSEYEIPARNYPGNLPQVGDYGHYYIGDPAIPANKIFNPTPYGGYDAAAGNFIHFAPFGQLPMVRWVEIIDPTGPDGHSGGTVKVHWNSYNTYGMEGGVWTQMMSMAAYEADHTETGIYGYANGNDLIGTGPYKFVEHDELADRGVMVKFEDYWNKTALEADGWYDVERYELAQFAPGDLGKDARNAALLTHEIDYAYDSMTMPIDYAAVMADPNINYFEDYVSEYQTQITLNSINETWWSGGVAKEYWYWNGVFMELGTWNYSVTNVTGYDGPYGWPSLDLRELNDWYPNENGKPSGIPIALREALTYAFDYDTLITVDLNNRAVRGTGLVGAANIFKNDSINLPTMNLTHARLALLNQNGIDDRSLTQPWWLINYTQLLSDASLTIGSTDAQWKAVAASTPIFTINFYWDEQHQELADQFELACNLLGGTIVQDADNKVPAGTSVWSHAVSSYWTKNLDGVSSIWSASAWVMDYHMPMTIPEGWIAANYGDPDRGSWRTEYWPTGASPGYWPTWNFGFSYDTEIDNWLAIMYMSEPNRKKEYIGKIANKEQNELFPMIYAYQTKGGEAVWANWDTWWVLDRDDRPAGHWGGISAQFLSYTPGAGDFPLIPGTPLLLTLGFSTAAMLGIIYSVMRKKKHQ